MHNRIAKPIIPSYLNARSRRLGRRRLLPDEAFYKRFAVRTANTERSWGLSSTAGEIDDWRRMWHRRKVQERSLFDMWPDARYCRTVRHAYAWPWLRSGE